MKRQNGFFAIAGQLFERIDVFMEQRISCRRTELPEKSALRLVFRVAYRTRGTVAALVITVAFIADAQCLFRCHIHRSHRFLHYKTWGSFWGGSFE